MKILKCLANVIYNIKKDLIFDFIENSKKTISSKFIQDLSSIDEIVI